MKPLLSKTTRPFLIYVLIVFAISVPVYFFAVDAIWKAELDEHNEIIAANTAYGLNQLKLTDEKLEESITLWNSIQPGTSIRNISGNDNLKDSTYTIDKQKAYLKKENIDRFRCLSTIVYLNNKPYRYTVETNIEEARETVAAIAGLTVFFFIIIVAGLLYLTRKLSATVWSPFRNTLEKLKTFNLNSQANIDFDKTDTAEFEALNQSLSKLIERNISAYKTQKEFTENASHELQTPLAILKNKLDILMQSKDLTERQYNIVEEMNKALTRSTRINSNLLLLAKIENNQFDESEIIRFDILLKQSLETLQEYFEQKNISVTSEILPGITRNGNNSLTEILINNLLLNAIRHTSPAGSIRIILTAEKFEVSNSGFKALDGDLLFKRFSRQSANSNGSGLGLAIIKEICNFHKWKIVYTFEKMHHIFVVHI